MKNYSFRFRDIHHAHLVGTYNLRDPELSKVDLDSVSVEQFTGLTDIDGTEIYENDVVQMTRISDDGENKIVSVGLVKYLAPSFVLYYPSTTSRLNFSEVINPNGTHLKVVGDISHPDLANLLK